MANLLGKTVAGKYVLLRLLGEGGMGRVYLGRELATQRQVAVKLLQESLSLDPRFISRMEREADAVRRVVHPNAVRLFDFGQDPKGVYLVMEYLSGESLWTRLEERGRLSPKETVCVLCQILLPLSLCHKAGVVHRDLKPDNIMLCPEGDQEVAKLLDFGIARLSEGPAVTRTGQILGTPAYMSPEQIAGRGIGPASDLYAVGVLLYELLTGRLPFDAQSQLELFRQHIQEPAPPLSRACPDEPGLAPFEPVVQKALAKSPKERFCSAEEMREALLAALSQAQQLATAPERAKDPSGRETDAAHLLAPVTTFDLVQEALSETWEEEGETPAKDDSTWTKEALPGAQRTLLLSSDRSAKETPLEETLQEAPECPPEAPSGSPQDQTLPMAKEAILALLETQGLCAMEVQERVCRESATETMPALSPKEVLLLPAAFAHEHTPLSLAPRAWWQALYLVPLWLFLWALRGGRALWGRLGGEPRSPSPSL
jgi:serine/threonine protein kinase